MHFILDCDDVLLNWLAGFRAHLGRRHGIVPVAGPSSWDMAPWLGTSTERTLELIEEFNSSEEFGQLGPVDGAFAAVRHLHDRGNRLTVITSCADDPAIIARRHENLRRVFGSSIDRVICVALGQSKRSWLDVLRPGIWIEDNYDNAIQGYEAGNKTFVMRRTHNRAQEMSSNPHLIWADDWQSIISHFS